MDFDQIIVEAEMWYNLIMNTNVDEEKGKEMVASLEKQRLRKLAEYEKTRENIGWYSYVFRSNALVFGARWYNLNRM